MVFLMIVHLEEQGFDKWVLMFNFKFSIHVLCCFLVTCILKIATHQELKRVIHYCCADCSGT